MSLIKHMRIITTQVINGFRYKVFALTGATASGGSNAGLAVIDGLSASQKVISNATYSDTDILAVVLVIVTGDTLVLSPKSGDPDYTLDATDIAALGAGFTIYGRFDSITSTGAGCKVLAYID